MIDMEKSSEREVDAKSPDRYYLALLGRPRLWRDDVELTAGIKYRKGLALLGYLAVYAGDWHSREQLADLLWPDLELAAARTNLRQVLNNLGALLNDNGTVLQKNGSSVALVPGARLRTDIALLSDTTLERVVSSTADARIWRERELEPEIAALSGEFLMGLQVPGTSDFDAWLAGQRHFYRERYALVLDGLCRTEHEEGHLGAAITTARHLVNLAPTDENHAFLLMTLLAEAGETRSALEAFGNIEQHLRIELDLAPSDRLGALRQQIVQQMEDTAVRSLNPPQMEESRRLVALYCASDSLQDDAVDSDFSERVCDIVQMRGGKVVSVLGRGVLAVFGLGDGAERPIQRAVLAARALLSSENATSPAPRIGISTGRVLLRPTAAIPHLAGDMLDAAAMTGWSAQPGEILVCAAVAAQGAEWFRFEAAGERTFPGLPGTRRLFRLIGNVDPAVADDTPLCGRETELALLQSWWEESLSGRTTVALLRAPAGLGKTRLANELARYVTAQGGRVRRVLCRLEHQHEPLAAVMATLGIPAGGKNYVRSKSEIFADVFVLLDAATSVAPVLLVVDDLHWSDCATQELLGQLASTLAQRRLMLVVTTRPEVALDFPEEITRVIELAPMDEADTLAMIAARDFDDVISTKERADIAAASGGIPLFIAHMVRSYLEGEHHHVPIIDLLQGELDQLGRHKPVLHTAAVLGSRFERRHLLALLPEADVPAALARAVDRRLIVATSAETCTFRHALIRDAAYHNLPISRRKPLHKRAAQLFMAMPEAAPEEIAQHFTAAGCTSEAVQWWAKAGDDAMAREFAADAMSSYRKALRLLDEAGTTADQEQTRSIRMRLGYAAQVAEGYGSPLTYQLFTDMVAEIEAMPANDPGQLFAALCGCYMGSSSFGKDDGLIIARRLQDLARSDAERLMAGFALGNTLFWRGDFQEAAKWQKAGISLAAEVPFAERIRYGVDDPAITCRAFHGWTLWFLGKEQAACTIADEAIALARRGKRTHGLCFALTFAASLHWCRGDLARVAALADETLALAKQYRFPLWEGIASLYLLWAQAASGDRTGGEQLFGAAAMLQQAILGRVMTGRWIVAHALIASGEWTAAEKLLDIALGEIEDHEEQYCRAELLRLKAACLEQRGLGDAAQALRRQGLALVQQQGARGLRERFTKK
jgi:DNA-binding SARP family transcriptional activator/tetratricopeptide (TPR) repeat protein